MKRLLLAPLGLFLLMGTAYPQGAVREAPYVYENVGFCRITSLSSAVNVVTASCSTGSVPTQAGLIAEICVETQAIRYRDDGTAPTSTIGIPVSAGACFAYSGPIAAMSMIQQAASATVEISFYH